MLPRGGGRCAPGVFFFFRIIDIQSYYLFPARFSPLNGILTVFPIQMQRRIMLTLLKNRSRSSQGHYLYIHCSTGVIDASCHVSLKSVNQFQIMILKDFTIYGRGGHLGYVTWINYIHIGSPFPSMLPIEFGFDCPSSFRKRIFEYDGNIHVYCPGLGADQPLGSSFFFFFFFFQNYMSSVNLHISCKLFFPFKWHFIIFPVKCMGDLC